MNGVNDEPIEGKNKNEEQDDQTRNEEVVIETQTTGEAATSAPATEQGRRNRQPPVWHND